MPIINPTIHQFVVTPDTYRRAGIVPPGWREIEPAGRWSNYHGLLSLDYPKVSYTKVPAAVNEDEDRPRGWREQLPRRLGGRGPQEKLLTITIPSADFRLWWINRWEQFEPPEAIKLIVFQADGYRLRRIEEQLPVIDEEIASSVPEITITPPTERSMRSEKTPKPDPRLLVPPTPRWMPPEIELPPRPAPAPGRRGLIRPPPHNQTVGVSHVPRAPPRLPQLPPLDNTHPVKTRDIPFVPLDEEEWRRDSMVPANEALWFGRGEFVWLRPMNSNPKERHPF